MKAVLLSGAVLLGALLLALAWWGWLRGGLAILQLDAMLC